MTTQQLAQPCSPSGQPTCADERVRRAAKSDFVVDRFQAMQTALNATKRPIVFAICEWGVADPWLWAPQVTHFAPTSLVHARGNAWPHVNLISAQTPSLLLLVLLLYAFSRLRCPVSESQSRFSSC